MVGYCSSELLAVQVGRMLPRWIGSYLGVLDLDSSPGHRSDLIEMSDDMYHTVHTLGVVKEYFLA